MNKNPKLQNEGTRAFWDDVWKRVRDALDLRPGEPLIEGAYRVRRERDEARRERGVIAHHRDVLEQEVRDLRIHIEQNDPAFAEKRKWGMIDP